MRRDRTGIGRVRLEADLAVRRAVRIARAVVERRQPFLAVHHARLLPGLQRGAVRRADLSRRPS